MAERGAGEWAGEWAGSDVCDSDACGTYLRHVLRDLTVDFERERVQLGRVDAVAVVVDRAVQFRRKRLVAQRPKHRLHARLHPLRHLSHPHEAGTVERAHTAQHVLDGEREHCERGRDKEEGTLAELRHDRAEQLARVELELAQPPPEELVECYFEVVVLPAFGRVERLHTPDRSAILCDGLSPRDRPPPEPPKQQQ